MNQSSPITSGRYAPFAENRLRRRRAPARTGPGRPRTGVPGDGHGRGQDLLVTGGVLLLTVLAYARTLGNGFIDFDDPESVIDNVTIRELSLENLGRYLTTPLQYMYTPLTSLSYAVDYRIGGLDPGVYHLTNLLLHLGNTVLVLLVVRALTGRALVSRLVTGAFAIHPVNVDAVAWISARGTLLATLSLLGALLAYTGYLRRLADGDRRWHLLALAWVLFVLAALAKSTAVVLPLILLLWDHHLSRRPSWGLLLEKVPFLAVSVVVGLVTLRFRTDLHGTDPYHPVDRFFLFTSVCVAYLRRLVAPHPLSFVYAYPERTGGHLPWQLYLTPLVLCLAVGLLSLLGVPGKVLVLGLSFFLVTLVLTQAVLLADNHQANRHVYLPYLGLYLVGAVLVERVLTASEGSRPLVAAGRGLLVVVVAALLTLTVSRTLVWRDTTALFTDSLRNEPNVPFAYNSLGIAKLNAGDHRGAIRDFERAAALDPTFNVHNNLGSARFELGDVEGALAEFTRAIEQDPRSRDAYYNRGLARARLADPAGACTDWRRALSLGHPRAADRLREGCGTP